MRLWIIYLFAVCLLVPATGCTTLQGPFGLGQKNSKQERGSGTRALSRRDTLEQDDVLDPLGSRDSRRLLLDDLAPSQFSTTWKARTGRAEGETAAQQYYNQGQQFYNQGSAALTANPNGSAHQASFVEAANRFRLASSAYPNSTLEGYAIAVYWLQLAEKSKAPTLTDAKRPKSNLAGEARRVLHRIRIDDPTGKLADDATLALGKAFMQSDRYYEAADTFEDLRRNYPGSTHRFDAHMLELQCRLEGYQGKSYDDTPLRKADDLMKAIVKQFPKESAEHLPYLEAQASAIQNQLAERDYGMATYFEGRGENLAAKIYYEEVAERYKDTQLAAKVEQQMEKISKLPPRPSQHAKWLIDMFPDPEREKPVIVAGNQPTFR